jgi:hypothetical protein
MNKLFPNQQENEQVFLILRQHWSILAAKIVVWFVFALIPFGLRFLVSAMMPDLLAPPYVYVYRIFEVLYALFLLLSLLMSWAMYYLNLHVVTNERIVDIEQKTPLHHTVAELHMINVQDVTAEVKGLLATVLNYGNVYIQTAAETERFVFNNVANPTKVSKQILELYDKTPKNRTTH